ncbi:MAG: nicotinamide-nucleotide amidase [Marinoscillum sp.]|jgi:nicotinamide-nucleotide amidase
MAAIAEIISIGDEILYGQTLDTNSHWISGKLDEIGIKVRRKITIGDEREEILSALRESSERVDIILITGGLGPTSDDLTKPLLAEYFGVGYTFYPDVLEHITELFNRRGREVTEVNRLQAELPSNCVKIHNPLGTAPAMWFDENNTIYVSMPGVPYEMKRMMEETILPKLHEKFNDTVIHHKIVKTVGIGESSLSEMIVDWEKELPKNIKLAYLPTFGQVKLRLTAIGNDLGLLEAIVDKEVKSLIPIIEEYVYGYDDDELEKVIGDMLLRADQTIAFAESCTGGYISHLITSIAGSSAYYLGSIVSYAYDVKVNSLDVDRHMMETEGAVSEGVVLQMAKSVREKLGADVGLSVSGIAGPGGDTEDKPVGTVWIAYSDRYKTIAKKFNFTKNRELNIKLSALTALNMFRINFSGN